MARLAWHGGKTPALDVSSLARPPLTGAAGPAAPSAPASQTPGVSPASPGSSRSTAGPRASPLVR